MTFATDLKQARKAAGLTQKQVADICGVSAQAVKNWEAERREPPTDPVLTQAQILELIAKGLPQPAPTLPAHKRGHECG